MSNKAVTTAPGEQTKIFNSAFISLLVINMMMHMGQQMSGTLISKYAKVLGAAPDVIGIVVFTLNPGIDSNLSIVPPV